LGTVKNSGLERLRRSARRNATFGHRLRRRPPPPAEPQHGRCLGGIRDDHTSRVSLLRSWACRGRCCHGRMPPRPFVLRVMRCLLALLGGGCRWLWSGRVALKLGVAQLVCPRLVHVGGRRKGYLCASMCGSDVCCACCARGLLRSPQNRPQKPPRHRRAAAPPKNAGSTGT
jgi:hypothetical protein